MRLQNCSWINRKIILSAHLKFVPFHTYLLDLVFLDIYCSGLQTVLDSQHQQSSADLSKKTDRMKVNWNGSFSNRHTRIPEHAYWMHTSQHPDMNECIHPYVHTSNATCIYAYVYANMYILTYSRTRRWQKFQKVEYIYEIQKNMCL